MYCKNCGAKLGSGNKFCTECGTKVELDETVEIQQNPELSQEQESHSEEMKLPELDLKGVFDDEIPMENTSETEWREMPEQSVVEENVEKSSMENEHVEENMQEKNLDPEICLDGLSNITLKMYRTKQVQEGFHTKGYIFKKGEFYRIIVGSSNVTQTALTTNKEWNKKIVSTKQGEYTQDILDDQERTN